VANAGSVAPSGRPGPPVTRDTGVDPV